jgi:hypothetical protein
MLTIRALASLAVLIGSTLALGEEPESGLFCPLAVEPNAGLTDSPEALQKRFLSVAREKSGYALLLRKEAEEALSAANVTDYAMSDVSLSKVATQGKVKNAGFVSLKLTDRNELMLQGRVVRSDGKLVKSSLISVPRGTQPLLDVLTTAAERFFDQLNGTAPPVAEVKPAVTTGPAKPVAVIQPTTPPNPGTALRILGIVMGAAGTGTAIAGAVVFGSAGTIEHDANGNVAAADAGRVKGVRAAQGAGLGLVTAGAALGITGLVMALAAPTAPVTAALAPRADGAVFVVEGRF